MRPVRAELRHSGWSTTAPSHGRVTQVRLPRRFLAYLQEYLRAFLIGRLGWNRLGGNLIVSGAFGLFRRDSVIEAGGSGAAPTGG